MMKKLGTILIASAGLTFAASSMAAPGARTVPACTKVNISATIEVAAGDTWDGLKKYGKWVCLVGQGKSMNGLQAENQIPTFKLNDGSTVTNVVIGDPNFGTGSDLAAGGADGVHCYGHCKITNVYWGDVGEDGATLKAKSGIVGKLEITGGAAFKAADKLFQHNADGEVIIKDFYASGIGKLYRSCGNCKVQFPRKVTITSVTLGTVNSGVAGVNSSYDTKSGIPGKFDVATFTDLNYAGSKHVCATYIGTIHGFEPVKDTNAANIKRSCIFK